jgi:hypothetical protein
VWQYYHYATDLALEEPQIARERYEQYQTASEVQRRKLVADTWTSAFFWPIKEDTQWALTYGEFLRLRDEGPEALSPRALDQIEEIADQYKFFHWHLEFPDVFNEDGDGGFDVIVGNVPWERIKLQEREFFADKDTKIANARTAAARRKLIEKLPQTDSELYSAYSAALRKSEAVSHFLRESGRYPLSAVGDINTYQVFAGLVRQIVGPEGRVGIIVPSGIATDYYNQDYFSTIVEERELVSFYDFENRKGLFPEVHRSYKFCLLTLAGNEEPEAEYAFFLHTADDLADPDRRFELGRDDLQTLSPSTMTIVAFRSRKDRDLLLDIHYRLPYFGNVGEKAQHSGWHRRMIQGHFHSSNDSHLFINSRDLGANAEHVRLYEPRMYHQYDHRFSTYGESGTPHHVSGAKHQEATYRVSPRYWIARQHLLERVREPRSWALVYRRVARSTDERTMIASFVPTTCVNENAVLLSNPSLEAVEETCLLANLCAFTLDYTLRQNDCFSISNEDVKQLPVVAADRYTAPLIGFIVPRVVELTYTAWDLQPFAQDVLDEVGEETWARWFADAPIHTSPPPEWAPGTTPPPFVWDEERRARLRAELDALYGHLYGLTREELAYILDTFPIVRRKDEAEYGEYRTKRMILEKYEEVEPLTH